MCLMWNPFHFPHYVPDMIDILKRKGWIQQGREIELLWSAKRRKEKKKIMKFNFALSFLKCPNHLLSDQEVQVSLKERVFTTQWQRHGRKFVCRYFALILFCGTYQAWLLDLEFMLGSKISFHIMHASHQTRSDLILQNSYLSLSHQKLLHSTGTHFRMSSTGHKKKERYSF